MEELKLKNGSVEPLPVVTATMMSLDNLLKNHVTAFYDLVMICRTANYRPFGNNGKVLRDLSLMEPDGNIHASIKNVVLSAVSGNGLQMVLGNPRALVPTSKQIEQLQLTARLAAIMCLKGQVDSDSADMCNLHELALAGLGYDDPHPQVPLDEIEKYVKNQLGAKLLPVEKK